MLTMLERKVVGYVCIDTYCLLLNTTTLSNTITFQLIASHMCMWQQLQIQWLLRNSQPGTCDSPGFKNLGGGKRVILINPQATVKVILQTPVNLPNLILQFCPSS